MVKHIAGRNKSHNSESVEQFMMHLDRASCSNISVIPLVHLLSPLQPSQRICLPVSSILYLTEVRIYRCDMALIYE